MIKRHLRVAVFACGLVAVYAQGADNGAKSSGAEASGSTTRGSSGPTADVQRDHKAPLQTGEVRVPPGSKVGTGEFDPNAGEGFKGQSTSVGTVVTPEAPGKNTGGTAGEAVGGSTSGERSKGGPDAGDRGQAKPPAKRDQHSSNSRGSDYESSLDPGLRIR